ncbi:lipocalin family protein [Marinomonas sp. C2222]|uniref:Outer membrane lipoprotein Blc n=1 Tax=Marinomonas sargassi TaxID=2984494 RepID=A0ABT2YQT5_9GAMM|nr:lipocalin family protein [Marinomonas sargassi]MCV2402250.1 lipocalin family protein [Marinomonas sargassi]
MKYLVSMILILLTACASQPQPPPAHLIPYLGDWYEIIRQDHAFEEGLTNVTASYVFDQGTINVKNRGYSSFDKEWREVKGRAELASSDGHDYLKVSFFRPFYGSYVVFELDKKSDQYALVMGLNGEHFWLLSKTPTMPKAVKNRLLARIKALGFHMDKLVEAKHAAL